MWKSKPPFRLIAYDYSKICRINELPQPVVVFDADLKLSDVASDFFSILYSQFHIVYWTPFGQRYCMKIFLKDIFNTSMQRYKQAPDLCSQPSRRLCLNKAASDEIIWHCKWCS